MCKAIQNTSDVICLVCKDQIEFTLLNNTSLSVDFVAILSEISVFDLIFTHQKKAHICTRHCHKLRARLLSEVGLLCMFANPREPSLSPHV